MLLKSGILPTGGLNICGTPAARAGGIRGLNPPRLGGLVPSNGGGAYLI